MNCDEGDLGADARPVELGRTYAHASHGRVEVTGIWQGTRWVDTAPPPVEQDEHEPVVVRYIPAEGGDWTDELAATLSDFRDAIYR